MFLCREKKMKEARTFSLRQRVVLKYSLVFSYSNNKSRISQPYDHDELEG